MAVQLQSDLEKPFPETAAMFYLLVLTTAETKSGVVRALWELLFRG